MYKVNEREFNTLLFAMEYAKMLNQFVTIESPDGSSIVGKFGVDSVENGKCPDGIAYDWNKASRIGRTKK